LAPEAEGNIMAIDPRISLAYQPPQFQQPDLARDYAQIAAIQQAQNQNALAQYQLGAAQREEAKVNALGEAYRAAYNPQTGEIDTNALRKTLAASGQGAQLPAVEKALGELETQKLTREKSFGELVENRMELSRARLDTVRTPDEYLAWHESNYTDPVLSKYFEQLGVTADQSRAQIVQKLQQPGGFQELLLGSALGLEKASKQHFVTQNLGGTTQVLSQPEHQIPGMPSKATVVPGSVAQVTMTPAEKVNIGLRQQEVGISERGLKLKEKEVEQKAVGIEGLSPKDLQKREAAYPQATAAIKGFEAKSEGFVKDLEALRNHPGLSNITGFIAGRTPSLTADGRAAQALYDKVMAKGGFQALQDIRAASTTGGALGSVSNQEGKQLTASFAAIDQRQDAKDVRAAIDAAIADVQGAKARMREAYDMTYQYKSGRGAAASQPAPAGGPKPSVSNW
jgi:hypothetical protein